ncbi:hypothetical protein DNTS_028776 [Danionella cerebrum]|uniref:Nuclear receptor domain-containing protein n=1 Tax=Danionella cerebrum TaxID=2873325 RepID=A0A553RNZ4_9TELE|nr:hypothetical protein DNTS_028776 [Danionella translucida]
MIIFSQGFFRRSIQQNIQYKKCLKTESCTIVRINRNRCQQCRFKKCLSVGMSRDAVRFGRIPKREKQRMLMEMQTAMNNMMNSSQLQNVLHSSTSRPDSPRSSSDFSETTVSMDTASSCCSDSGEEDASGSPADPETLSRGREEDGEPQQEPWSRVEVYREQMNQNAISHYHTNHRNDVETSGNRGHLVCPRNPFRAAHEVWEDFSRSFVPAVRDVVEFAKGIPGFLELSQHDQVNLLKAGTFEVLMVRFVSQFDVSERTVSFLGGRKYSVDLLRSMGAGELLSCMFEFSEKFTALSLSEEEISLFSAVVLVSAGKMFTKI